VEVQIHTVVIFRELRRIFGRKREEVEGGWRRLHNEERVTSVNN
jgi:hypothetical protein